MDLEQAERDVEQVVKVLQLAPTRGVAFEVEQRKAVAR